MNDQNSVPEMSPELIKAKIDAISAELPELTELIKSEMQAVRPKVPEHVFVNLFLPFFANLPNKNPKVNLGVWTAYIKHPNMEVDVVDDNDNALFSVPPIMSPKLLNPMSHEAGRSLQHSLYLAAIRQDRDPKKAQEVFDGILKRFDFVAGDRDEKLEAYRKRWVAIFERYGITNATESNEPGETTPAQEDEEPLFEEE